VRSRNAALVLAAILVSLAIFAACGGVRQVKRPTELVMETFGGALLVATAVAFVALHRGASMLGRAGVWLLGAAVVTPVVLLAWKIGISAGYPAMMLKDPERVGFRCLRLACTTSALPLAALIAVRRNSDPTHPRLTGAAIGTAVGAGSWLLVDLWCPVAYVPHLFLGHVLPLVLATVAGAVAGGRVIAIRAHRGN
jgi:hypothetical protein